MSRLEVIKRNFEVMTSEEKTWLIQQAERVEEIEEAALFIHNMQAHRIRKLKSEVTDLKQWKFEHEAYIELLEIDSELLGSALEEILYAREIFFLNDYVEEVEKIAIKALRGELDV